MGTRRARFLCLGYGNPGRLDDGLGPAAIARLEALDLEEVALEADYQLTVEDAAEVARHDVVVFVDASLAGPEPFGVERVSPATDLGFSTHEVDAGTVLGLASALFGAQARGYQIGVRGYDFDAFGEELSPRAEANLSRTIEFLRRVLKEGDEDALKARCSISAASRASP